MGNKKPWIIKKKYKVPVVKLITAFVNRYFIGLLVGGFLTCYWLQRGLSDLFQPFSKPKENEKLIFSWKKENKENPVSVHQSRRVNPLYHLTTEWQHHQTSTSPLLMMVRVWIKMMLFFCLCLPFPFIVVVESTLTNLGTKYL